MRLNVVSAVSAALLALAGLSHAPVARAGDVSNAQLACIVDTYAWDYEGIGECTSFWTPSTATNPTTASFWVVGLPAGSYTYYWTDMNTGQVGVCGTNSGSCNRSLRVGQSKTLRLTVIDNATGASKTVFATAYFEDGWN